jgi:hypothetical protein
MYEKENLETIEKLRDLVKRELLVYGDVYLTTCKSLTDIKSLDIVRSASRVISVQVNGGKLELMSLKNRY